MVRVRTLQRVTVPHTLFPEASPAATHSHRVAAHVSVCSSCGELNLRILMRELILIFWV